MPSGAGLNRVGNNGGKVLVTCTGDGTYDSGIVMSEAMGFSKWVFQLRATAGTTDISGWEVTCYFTIDPNAYDLYTAQFTNGGALGTLDTNSWVGIPAPSVEGASPDAYTWANPLTDFGQALYTPSPAVAVRVVAVGSTSSGGIDVLGFAIP